MKDRIVSIIGELGFSPSQFADQIGVSRSIMSHILSGRNNPSLDVIIKILSTYKEVSPDWLLMATGDMFRPSGKKTSGNEVESPTKDKGSSSSLKEVDYITIYYKDKTFENFKKEG